MIEFGPLDALARDPTVTDVAITCEGRVWADRGGGMTECRLPMPLRTPRIVREYAVRLCAQLGRRLDDACPIADASSEDGIRVHAVIAPLVAQGAAVTIRFPDRRLLGLTGLRDAGMFPPDWLTLLRNLVKNRARVLISGGTGSGKTTLLKLMLGQLQADSGRIHVGTKLEVAYFDQHRAELDPDKTVMDNLAEGKQEVMVNGKPRHVLGYLQDFLFHPKRAMTPVRALSGGERNRLLLARLFLKPSNLLILDEPTNDLDVETLELLEELIDSYQGTVLLVSHDRQFVDNTVTECWIFEGGGKIGRYVGGYHDARGQQEQYVALKQPAVKKTEEAAAAKAETVKRSSSKLSYKLQRELEQLPQLLEDLEAKLEALQTQVADASFFSQPHEQTQKVLADMAAAEQELEQAFERWEYLEALKNGG